MRQCSPDTRILIRDQAIYATINRQHGRHRGHGFQIPALQKDAGDDAKCQVAAAYALHKSGSKSVVFNGHAKASGEGRRAEKCGETSAQEEAGDKVVGDEFEGILVRHFDWVADGIGIVRAEREDMESVSIEVVF
jgi:hypothetical protein